jgi:hypothetical protein
MDMRTVAIYGSSLVLSSIRASLEHRAGLRVLAFDAATPGATEQLGAMCPDAIVFDLASPRSDSAFVLWKAQPQALLIGVDMAADQVLVFSGQTSRVLTPDDLVEVIETHAALDTKH